MLQPIAQRYRVIRIVLVCTLLLVIHPTHFVPLVWQSSHQRAIDPVMLGLDLRLLSRQRCLTISQYFSLVLTISYYFFTVSHYFHYFSLFPTTTHFSPYFSVLLPISHYFAIFLSISRYFLLFLTIDHYFLLFLNLVWGNVANPQKCEFASFVWDNAANRNMRGKASSLDRTWREMTALLKPASWTPLRICKRIPQSSLSDGALSRLTMPFARPPEILSQTPGKRYVSYCGSTCTA